MQFLLLFIAFFFVSNLQAQSNDLVQLSFSELDSLMEIQYREENYAAVMVSIEAARDKAAAEIGEEDSVFAVYTGNLAFFESHFKNVDRAEELYWQALRIQKKVLAPNNQLYANVLNNLASLYRSTGKYQQAESLYLEAKTLYEDIFGVDAPKYAIILGNLADIYELQNAAYKAEKTYYEALRILEKNYGKENTDYALTLSNLSNFYWKQKTFGKAKKYALEALAIRKKLLGTNHPRYASSLHNIAALFNDLKEYDKAIAYYIESRQIWEKTLGEKHLNCVASYNQLAEVYVNINAFEKAEKCYSKAINLNVLNRDSIGMHQLEELVTCEFMSGFLTIISLEGLYQLSNKKFQLTEDKATLLEANKTLKIAMQINEQMRNELIEEKDKLRLLKELSFLTEMAIASDQKLYQKTGDTQYLQESFLYAEQNKSVLLTDAIKGSKAKTMSDLPNDLAEQEEALKKSKTLLQKRIKEATNDSLIVVLTRELNVVKQEEAQLLKSFKTDYPKYHALKYENILVQGKELQAQLDDKTALLEYFVGDSSVYLFLVQKNDLQLFSFDVNKMHLRQKVQALRKDLSDYKYILANKKKAMASFISNATWFYETLLNAALEKQDGGIENLVIVTDGELGHLPFEIFLTRTLAQTDVEVYKDLPYLVKDYNIVYNYSATLFLAAKNTNKQINNHEMLAFASAYPSLDSAELYENRSRATGKLRTSLNPLPAAQSEVRLLAAQYAGTFLQRDSANEAFFKTHAEKYGLIHLAMHGVLNPKTPILSSLAFTENGDSLEDNFLQAYEIAQLKLQADLVVLSACETGFGQFEQGEGVISLARSFMYAGVPSLVVSLWQVNDGSTAIIMQQFYKKLEEGLPKDQALRQAKLHYLNRVKGIAGHPAFWSPFIQLGDSRPIQVATKGGNWNWLLGVLGALLLGAGFLFVRKKRVES